MTFEGTLKKLLSAKRFETSCTQKPMFRGVIIIGIKSLAKEWCKKVLSVNFIKHNFQLTQLLMSDLEIVISFSFSELFFLF